MNVVIDQTATNDVVIMLAMMYSFIPTLLDLVHCSAAIAKLIVMCGHIGHAWYIY